MCKSYKLLFLIGILVASLIITPVMSVRALSFPAQMNKSFSPYAIEPGDTSTLSVTIYNPNAFPLTAAHYNDFFPAGISLANPVNVTDSCGGTVTDNLFNPLVPGGTMFRLDGGTVPAQVGPTPGACTVTVMVTSTTPGNLINTIPASGLTSTGNDGGTDVPVTNADPASATLNVGTVKTPDVAKSFAPNTIFVGAVSTLTISVTNNDPSTTLTETTLTDYLPTNVVLANPVNPTLNANCGTGAVVGNPGDPSVTLNNAQIGPTLVCTITVNVTSTVQGAYLDTIPAGPAGLGSIKTHQGVTNGSPATANLNVQAFTMTKAFVPASIPAGSTSILTITIRNRGIFAYTGVGLFDDLYALSGNNLEFVVGTATFTACGGMSASVTNTGLPSTVNNRATFSGGTLAAGATCSITINVRALQNAPATTYTNTIPAGRITTTQGATNDQPVSSNLAVTGLVISKTFAPNSIPVGSTSLLTITLTNASPLPYTVASLTDNFGTPTDSYVSIAAVPGAATTCAGGAVTTAARSVTLTGGTIPALGSCTITVNVVGSTVGNNRTNTIPAGALTTVEGGTNPAPATNTISVTAVAPTVAKAFSGTSGNNQIVAGGTSTLTITITNPVGAVALTNLGLVDNLALPTQTNLVFTSLTSNNCGGSVTGAGTQVITLSGGALAGGSPAHSCTIVVVVTLPLTANGATVTNTIPVANFTNDQGIGITAPVTRNLIIRSVDLASKTFTPTTFQSGGTSSLVITLQNYTATALTVATLTDNLLTPTNSNLFIAAYPPATAPSTTCTGGVITAVAGAQLITLTGGTIPAGTYATPGTCTLTVPVTGTLVGGPYTNTIPVGNLTTVEGPSSRTARTATVTIYTAGAGVTLTKAYGTNPVNAGGNSQMTLTINAPLDTNLTNFSITDTFLANMVVGNPPAATVVSGCGALAFTPAPTAGAGSITASGGTVTTGTPCVIRVNVTGNIGGSYINTIHPADITNTQGRSIPANVNQTLNVNAISTLLVTKNFQPATVNTNGLSLLTIYLENSNTSALINSILTDNLPYAAGDGVVVAPTPNASTNCGAGVITAVAGSSTISMANGTIPPKVGAVDGLCSISVNVQGKHATATLPATYTNTIPTANVTGTNQTTGETMHSTAPASANLVVAPLFIGVVKNFAPLTVFGGSASTLSVELLNPNTGTSLTGIQFTDNMPAGMIIANPENLNVGTCGGAITGLAGASTFSFSGGSLPANGTCTLTLSATMTVNGNLTNTIPAGAVTTFNGASDTQLTQVTLTNVAGASISKAFAPNPIYAGNYSLLTITIKNTEPVVLTGMGLVDTLPGTLPAGLAIAGGSAPAPSTTCGVTLTAATGSQMIQLVGGTLASNATCTIVVGVTSTVAGDYKNTIPVGALSTSNVPPVTNQSEATDTLTVQALASLGDFVWNDVNADGIQAAGEAGISGVTVNLLGPSGPPILATTTTDANGLYHFTNLVAGTYRVEFVKPAGYTFSPSNQGADTALDSDVDTTSGTTTSSYTLAPGDNNLTVDAGLYQPAALGDFVWSDVNQDGIQDSGEAGISGVTVNLLGPTGSGILGTTTTDVNGLYHFINLAPGTYRVEFVKPAGYTFSPSNQGADTALDSDANTSSGITTTSYTLAPGDNNITVDAGLFEPAALGDFVWNDVNADGIQDAGEAGISGVTVNLLGPSGSTILGTTTTDVNGLYHFTDLMAGTYRLEFIKPTGYTFSPSNQGTDDALDSDADTTGGITTGSYTLVPGDNNLTVDAGLYQPAALGDFVWNDVNANGIQDAGEAGISGITVNLLGPTGSGILRPTTTDVNGLYHFTNLVAGTYRVEFINPGGYTFSPSNQGADDALDSDADTTTGITTGSYTLAPGDNNLTVDAGLFGSAALGDFVWNDVNANGIQDAGEAGISGVTVNLLGPTGSGVLATTTTDANGLYHFTGLSAGTYRVQFIKPGGYTFSPSNQGADTALDSDADITTGITTGSYALAVGDNNLTVDAGLFQPAALGDFVWNDVNQDGIQDAGEAGISGVTVNLLGPTGSGILGTTTTDVSGLYHFTNLVAGTYRVEFVKPAGYTFSPSNQGTDDALDSDADTTTGITTGSHTLAPGDNNLTVDAGLFQSAALGDFVWNDVNANGIQDAGEAGISGVTVNLLGPTGATILATTSTDVNGLYHFTDLMAGTYRVEFIKPTGYTFSPANQGTDIALDSDADTTSGITTGSYTLAAGDNNLTVDAGLFQSAALGDFVWNDVNANGIQDAGEAGISGVTVNLLGPTGSGILATTTTDVNGLYHFINLTPGTYRVEFINPGGYTFSSSNQGTDDALDSDADTTTGITTGSYTLALRDNNLTVDAGLFLPTPGLFDPPSGQKVLSAALLPELEWRMVWINNTNTTAINVQITDPIPAGTTYVLGSLNCVANNASVTISCLYDSVLNRIFWQGHIAPDFGVTDPTLAVNEVIITFRVTVPDALYRVNNQGSSLTDTNGDGSFADETTAASVAVSNLAGWSRGPDADASLGKGAFRLLPLTGFAPGVTTVLPPQPSAAAYNAEGNIWLEIPRLGFNTPIIGVPFANGTWDVTWISKQAGWLQGTAFPTWSGNSVLTGHVYLSNGLPGPFMNLHTLQWGDQLIVHLAGQRYIYQVRSEKVVSPGDTSVFQHQDDPWLTLITCKDYNAETNTYAHRVAVAAVLVKIENDTSPIKRDGKR